MTGRTELTLCACVMCTAGFIAGHTSPEPAEAPAHPPAIAKQIADCEARDAVLFERLQSDPSAQRIVYCLGGSGRLARPLRG